MAARWAGKDVAMKLQVRMASVLLLSVLGVVLAIPPAWGQASSLRQSPAIQKLIKESPLARRIIGQLSDEDLEALAAGADPATIKPLIDLGAANVDARLVFTPVTPCRLIDTRVPVPIPFAAGEQRNYDLIGPTDYSGIGGNPLGCGIPGVLNFVGLVSYNTPRALVLNIVAVGAGGPGDLRAFPPDESAPTASVINFADLSSVGLNVANGIVLKTCSIRCTGFFSCGEPCPLGDLAFLADVSGTHLVVDVVGYFSQPETVITQAEADTPELALTGVCREILSCAVLNTSSNAQTVLVIGSATVRLDHTAGTDDRFVLAIRDTSANCDANPGEGTFEVPSVVASTPFVIGTVTTMRTFTAPANTLTTFYMNGIMSAGVGGTDVVQERNIVCLIP
jgi:hypothetical protein